MNSIDKLEYKSHKFIKIFFRFLFFIFGFISGLCISNVKAYDITNNSLWNISNLEDFVVEHIPSSFPSDFSVDDYPYVIVKLMDSNPRYISVYFFKNLDNVYARIMGNASKTFSFYYENSPDAYYYNITQNLSYNLNNGRVSSSGSLPVWYYSSRTTSQKDAKYFTSFSLDDLPSGHLNLDNTDFSGYTSTFDVLEFSSTPVFDLSIFDLSEFKNVCVNPNDSFSITSKVITGYDDDDSSPYFNGFDFVWFPYNVSGLDVSYYYTNEDSHILKPKCGDGDFYGCHFYLSPLWYIKILETLPDPNSGVSMGPYFSIAGYNDLKKYFGYTAYPFSVTLIEQTQRYPIFKFDDTSVIIDDDVSNSGSSGGGHGSSGGRHDNTEYLSDNIRDSKLCFYIRRDYDVNILNKNSNGDYYSDITILGDINVSNQTYQNEIDIDNLGVTGKIKAFFNEIKGVITFINSYIYNFYLSMPLIVRLFIITFLIIFNVVIIIKLLF